MFHGYVTSSYMYTLLVDSNKFDLFIWLKCAKNLIEIKNENHTTVGYKNTYKFTDYYTSRYYTFTL